jgi:hypothetical protein
VATWPSGKLSDELLGSLNVGGGQGFQERRTRLRRVPWACAGGMLYRFCGGRAGVVPPQAAVRTIGSADPERSRIMG